MRSVWSTLSVSRPVRLLLVTDSLEVGGAERHVVDLAVALHQKGFEVVVACSASGPLAQPLLGAGVPVKPLLDRKVKRRVSLTYALRLRRLMKGARFDLVHAHVYASGAAAALASLGSGVPLVLTEHTEALWQGRRARTVSRFVYARARHIIVVSNAIRRRLVKRDGVPPNLITVVPNAVSAVACTAAAPQGLPAELGEGPLVGVIARLQPEKGLDHFLKAAARVAALVPEARFIVVGDGPLRGELEALARRIGVGESVCFLGFRADAREVTGLLDVLVVPSLTEGSPLVVLEAMAAGVPVVASDVGGIPDQIRHEREGLLVPPGDPKALEVALLCLLRDPAYARVLGEEGRRRAHSEFGHGRMVRRIEEVYLEILGRSGARDAAPEEPELNTSL